MTQNNVVALPFFKVTDTSHIKGLGAIITHFWAATDQESHLKQTNEDAGEDSLLITDYQGNTTLHYAAAARAYNAAKYLISLFPTHHFFNYQHITPAHIAAELNDVTMLQILKENHVLIRDSSFKNWAPIHFAIYRGSYEAFRYLLIENLTDLSQLIYEMESSQETFSNQLKFYSPLDLAIHFHHAKIVKLLEDYNALPSFHTAVKTNNLQAITYHLFSNPDLDIDAPSPYRKSTPLHIAAGIGNYSICQCLLESGASIGTLNADGLSALELAVIADSTETVTILIPKCTPDLCSKATFLAADLKRIEIAKILLSSPLSPSLVADDGDSLLIRLIKRKLFTLAEQLLEQKPDLLQKDSDGAIALHYAALSGSQTLLTSLVTPETIDAIDNRGLTPLFYAILVHDNNAIQILLSNGCKVDIITSFGITPVAFALALELSSMLSLTESIALTKCTINIERITDISKNNVKSLDLPDYKQIANMSIKCPQLSLYGPQFIRACKAESMELYINKTDGVLHGGTILHMAIIFEARSGCVSQMIMKCHQLIDMGDDLGRTPLHLSIMLRRSNIITLLLKYNVNIMIRDNENNTIFHYMDKIDVYERLQDVITNTNLMPNETNSKGETPIHTICRYGSKELLKIFISLLSTTNVLSILTMKNNKGKTALDIAVKHKNIDCISLLHSQGVPNPLVEAIKSNNFDKMKSLIENGYPVNSCDKTGITPLHAATNIQSKEMVKYLLQKGSDVNSRTTNGL
ncbi:ankyrin repeat protein [Histomonas meleagridis]|nr:ankyrin repeat protein [Histomonas meleagridis]